MTGEEKRRDFMAALEIMEEEADSSPSVGASSLDAPSTAVFVIDMLKGFAQTGPLSDKRIAALAKPIDEMLRRLPKASVVFLNDAHPEEAEEFGSYPSHCVEGTEEAEIVEALRPHADRGTVLKKNSTNGFVSQAFQDWFEDNAERFSAYVLTGDCTDICIKQFALTLKAWFVERNKKVRVLVPMELVDTFDLKAAGHDGDLMHLLSLYEMERGGVEIVKSVL